MGERAGRWMGGVWRVVGGRGGGEGGRREDGVGSHILFTIEFLPPLDTRVLAGGAEVLRSGGLCRCRGNPSPAARGETKPPIPDTVRCPSLC